MDAEKRRELRAAAMARAAKDRGECSCKGSTQHDVRTSATDVLALLDALDAAEARDNQRCRAVAQRLVAGFGSDGPENAEEAAERAVRLFDAQKARADAMRDRAVAVCREVSARDGRDAWEQAADECAARIAAL